MKNIQIFLLNGPIGCGKDTVARMMKAALNDQVVAHDVEHSPRIMAETIKFADPLRVAMQPFVGPLLCNYARPVDEALWNSKLEELKPEKLWDDKTVRDCMISLSEDWAKKFFNKGILGDILADKISLLADREKHNVFFVSDSGFKEEAEVLVNTFGEDAVELVHITRRGCTYAGDSRGYIEAPDIGLTKDCEYLMNNRDTLCLYADALSLFRGLIYKGTKKPCE